MRADSSFGALSDIRRRLWYSFPPMPNTPTRRALGAGPLAMAIFFCVSGGPYGLESLVQASGLKLALVLIVLTPLVWALPSALMSAELGSAIPVEGGYYHWVKRAFGPLAGFLCAWWTWLYSWVDVAIYPGLFVGYLDGLAQVAGYGSPFADRPWLRWCAGLLVIVPMTWLNLRGTRGVGRSAVDGGFAQRTVLRSRIATAAAAEADGLEALRVLEQLGDLGEHALVRAA